MSRPGTASDYGGCDYPDWHSLEELTSQTLLANPHQWLADAARTLDNDQEWKDQFNCMTDLQKLAKFRSDLFGGGAINHQEGSEARSPLSLLELIIERLVISCGSLRSAVAKNAMLTISAFARSDVAVYLVALFNPSAQHTKQTGRTGNPIRGSSAPDPKPVLNTKLDELVGVLISKAGAMAEKKFIVGQAEETLTCLAQVAGLGEKIIAAAAKATRDAKNSRLICKAGQISLVAWEAETERFLTITENIPYARIEALMTAMTQIAVSLACDRLAAAKTLSAAIIAAIREFCHKFDSRQSSSSVGDDLPSLKNATRQSSQSEGIPTTSMEAKFQGIWHSVVNAIPSMAARSAVQKAFASSEGPAGQRPGHLRVLSSGCIEGMASAAASRLPSGTSPASSSSRVPSSKLVSFDGGETGGNRSATLRPMTGFTRPKRPGLPPTPTASPMTTAGPVSLKAALPPSVSCVDLSSSSIPVALDDSSEHSSSNPPIPLPPTSMKPAVVGGQQAPSAPSGPQASPQSSHLALCSVRAQLLPSERQRLSATLPQSQQQKVPSSPLAVGGQRLAPGRVSDLLQPAVTVPVPPNPTSRPTALAFGSSPTASGGMTVGGSRPVIPSMPQRVAQKATGLSPSIGASPPRPVQQPGPQHPQRSTLGSQHNHAWSPLTGPLGCRWPSPSSAGPSSSLKKTSKPSQQSSSRGVIPGAPLGRSRSPHSRLPSSYLIPRVRNRSCYSGATGYRHDSPLPSSNFALPPAALATVDEPPTKSSHPGYASGASTTAARISSEAQPPLPPVDSHRVVVQDSNGFQKRLPGTAGGGGLLQHRSGKGGLLQQMGGGAGLKQQMSDTITSEATTSATSTATPRNEISKAVAGTDPPTGPNLRPPAAPPIGGIPVLRPRGRHPPVDHCPQLLGNHTDRVCATSSRKPHCQQDLALAGRAPRLNARTRSFSTRSRCRRDEVENLPVSAQLPVWLMEDDDEMNEDYATSSKPAAAYS